MRVVKSKKGKKKENVTENCETVGDLRQLTG